MKLDARLRAIVAEIDGASLLDIGCDHGKVLVAALTEGRVMRAKGVDISPMSLKKAERLAKLYGADAEFVTADGKDVSFENHDVLVVAGMGGSEIAEILNGRVSYPETLILVPHQDKNLLRMFLNDKGLYPQKDFTVESAKRFYDVIVIKTNRSGTPYLPKELYLGKNVPERPEFYKKARARAKVLKERIDSSPTVSESLKEEWEAYSEWLG